MVNLLSMRLPLYIVTEYPKSGGTWLAQILADYLDIPFPRNQAPKIQSNVMHGHYGYSSLMENVVVLFRDGRDVIVSEYYYSLFPNDRASPFLINETRSALRFHDYDDVRNNLPKFIEYIFEKRMRSKSPFQFSWAQFVRIWAGKDVITVKYEDMVDNTAIAVRPVIQGLTHKETDLALLSKIVDSYSFQKQAGRKPGVEKNGSFLRKGTYGDWHEKFSPIACEIFDAYAGDELIELGYESDHLWVLNHTLRNTK